MVMFKIEVEDSNGVWSDVRGADGNILTFENENDARAKLMELYPVMVRMEKYAGGKHARVVRVHLRWNICFKAYKYTVECLENMMHSGVSKSSTLRPIHKAGSP